MRRTFAVGSEARGRGGAVATGGEDIGGSTGVVDVVRRRQEEARKVVQWVM